jgi:nucleotide-binding universal stress UspA family protein
LESKLMEVMVAHNGTDAADDGLALANDLARAASRGILIAYIVQEQPRARAMNPEYQRAMHGVTERVLHPARDRVQGVSKLEICAIAARSPARGLITLAEDEKPYALVLGSTHHGPVGQVLVGGVAESLLHGSTRPVAVAPRGFAERRRDGIRTIGVAYDGSPPAVAALAAAAELADATGARLRLLAVAEPAGRRQAIGHSASAVDELLAHRREELQGALASGLADAVPAGVSAEVDLLEGDPAAALCAAGEGTVDLLFAGSRSYSHWHRVMLGSVSSRLMRSAPFPVIVVPGRPEGEAAG